MNDSKLRALLAPAGACVIGAGVGVNLSTGLGAGPVDVLTEALTIRTGASYTLTLAAMFAAMIAISLSLGKRPGPTTLITPLMVGPAIDISLATLPEDMAAYSILARIAIHACGVAMIGAGAAAVILARTGPAAVELTAMAISGKTGSSEVGCRTALEGSFLLGGWALGGTVGAGTAMAALGIGQSVRVFEKAAARYGLER